MRDLFRGAPILVVAALLLIAAATRDTQNERQALAIAGIVLLSAWAGAYLRGWVWSYEERNQGEDSSHDNRPK